MSLLRNKIWQLEVDEKNAEIERLKQLITELCNALEEEFGTLDHQPALKDKSPWTIIQRAKETTQ